MDKSLFIASWDAPSPAKVPFSRWAYASISRKRITSKQKSMRQQPISLQQPMQGRHQNSSKKPYEYAYTHNQMLQLIVSITKSNIQILKAGMIYAVIWYSEYACLQLYQSLRCISSLALYINLLPYDSKYHCASTVVGSDISLVKVKGPLLKALLFFELQAGSPFSSPIRMD